MSSEAAQLLLIAHDITSHTYYGLAAITILCYDYLLTLGDEVKYFWNGKKTWTFWLFIINRYFPVTFQVWLFTLSYSPYSSHIINICDKSAWYSALTWGISALLARVAVTARIYAVTLGNIPSVVVLSSLSAMEFILGIVITIDASKRGANTFPPIAPNAYHLCGLAASRGLLIASSGISLLYDSIAFTAIITAALKSKAVGTKVSVILATIVEDSTRYFLVIFASQFVFIMTLTLGRPSIQILPGLGNVVYLPVMIGRIMLSLRKAANDQQGNLSIAELSTNVRSVPAMRFFRPRSSQRGTQGDIRLDTISEPQATIE